MKKSIVFYTLFVLFGFVIFAGPISEVEAEGFSQIFVDQAAQLIEENKSNPEFVILDVRSPDERSERKVINSLGINYYDDDFVAQLASLDRSKTYLVYCRSGNRSSRTMPIMQELGFTSVYELAGGMNAVGNEIATE